MKKKQKKRPALLRVRMKKPLVEFLQKLAKLGEKSIQERKAARKRESETAKENETKSGPHLPS